MSKRESLKIELQETVFVPVSRCVKCNKTLDCATGLETQTPEEDDFAVCSGCGKIMVYLADKKLRAATDEELNDFKTEAPEMWQLIERLNQQLRAAQARRNN